MPKILLAAAILSVLGCRRESPATVIPTESDLEERPSHESWGTDSYQSENGIPVIRMQAPYTRRYDHGDSTLTILTAMHEQRVIATIYDGDGAVTATVTADEIRYVEEQNRFDAFGQVVVTTDSGKTLETEHLYWLDDKKMVYAPGFAKLRTTDRYIQGYELEATEDLASYSMARVTGEVEVEE
ncbi:MAG: LPS export ABC transporter periplasmic protein LptC [Rhodothermales bacterium]|nr:LPS export ABC transporter periplasmic protein LptC [Rhodothermales bacterium]